MSAQIREISPQQRKLESTKVIATLRVLLQEYRTIALFYPLGLEINIWPLVKELSQDRDKVILLPKSHQTSRTLSFHRYTSSSDLGEKSLGVQEPITREHLDKIDIVVVPLRAVDLSGHRLGRGGGYYDSYLSAHPNTPTIGVGYQCQLVDAVPVEPHDQRILQICLPGNTYDTLL